MSVRGKYVKDLMDLVVLEKKVKSKLDELSTPYGLKQYVDTINLQFLKDKIKEVNHRYKLGFNLRSNYSMDDCTKTSVVFKSGNELLDQSKSASLYMKPFMLYYGLNQIYSAFIDLIIDKPWRSRGHGIHNESDVKDGNILWNLKIARNENVFLKKLNYIIELLSGQPTFISQLYYDLASFKLRSNLDKELVKLGDNKKSVEINLLQTIMNIETKKHILYLSDDCIILNFLCHFIFCANQRYNPEIWLKHLQGNEFMYLQMIKVYESIYFDINYFLEKVQCPYTQTSHSIDDAIRRFDREIESEWRKINNTVGSYRLD